MESAQPQSRNPRESPLKAAGIRHLKERFGIQVGDRRGVISVAPVGAQDAALLGLEPDASVLLYRSIVSDRHGKPIEHMISVNHPQRVMFQTSADLLSLE